jgi:hypothetical protein
METFWIPKLWALTIPSIWTCGRPNSDNGARRYDPRNPCCAVSPKSEQIIFQGWFGNLIFVSKERNQYQNWMKFRAIQPGHRICIIWSPDVGDVALARKAYKTGKSGQGWFYGNQVLFSPKEDLVQGKVEHARRLPKGINTTPWAPKEGGSIHPFIREPRDEGEASGRSRRPQQVLELPRRWPRPCLAAMFSPAWWSHGGVLEPMPWFDQGNCTFYIRWWYKSCLFFTLIYIDECFIHMCS